MPWVEIGLALAGLVVGAITAAFSIKLVRGLRRSSSRLVYRGMLDRLSDLGYPREIGETRERHAARVADITPSFTRLTSAHLRETLGGRSESLPTVAELARNARIEISARTSFLRRLRAALNPLGWWFTR
jgi:hypothetical protein